MASLLDTDIAAGDIVLSSSGAEWLVVSIDSESVVLSMLASAGRDHVCTTAAFNRSNWRRPTKKALDRCR